MLSVFASLGAGILVYELLRDWIGIGDLRQPWTARAPWWALGACISLLALFLKRRIARMP
jgi:hypothetical protein